MTNDDGLPIEVDDLMLRRLEYSDATDLFEIYSNPDVARYQFFTPWTMEQVEQFVYSQSDVFVGDPGVPFVLVAVLLAEKKVIGDCQITINSVQDRQGEIGFTFNPLFSGHGFATKTVHAALGYGFTRLNLHRIIAGVDARNEQSWRLMERVGMRREAHFVHANLVEGKWIDDYIYAMLEDEWKEPSTAGWPEPIDRSVG
ncbi:MAG: GNAT family N-acetyltransferase [Planctomycetaceae bacterium]|nr:GNAT family N-acetyltransferase [Planctomycetaceae bacterium]